MAIGKLYMTVGSARCGKSTYCTNWVKEKTNRVIVCSDDIRKALHGNRYASYSEGMVYAIKGIMIRALLSRGFDVIVDGTHTSRESVKRILEIDPDAVAILFDTDEETCIERAKTTNQEDLIPVIQGQFRNLESIRQEFGTFGNFMQDILKDINSRWGQNSVPNIVRNE